MSDKPMDRETKAWHEMYERWESEKEAHALTRSTGSRYPNIQSETAYRTLMNSGMFFEFHPELSGDWERDRKIIFENK